VDEVEEDVNEGVEAGPEDGECGAAGVAVMDDAFNSDDCKGRVCEAAVELPPKSLTASPPPCIPGVLLSFLLEPYVVRGAAGECVDEQGKLSPAWREEEEREGVYPPTDWRMVRCEVADGDTPRSIDADRCASFRDVTHASLTIRSFSSISRSMCVSRPFSVHTSNSFVSAT
jgi:hypothetical protein